MERHTENEHTPAPGSDTEALGSKTVRGVMWTFAEMFGRYGVTWVITIYLARLLSPADYGLVGLTVAFLTIATVIIEGGFRQALIRKKSVTPADYNTVFLTNLAFSFIMYAAIYLCAPHIARFCGEPQLAALIRLLGVTLITNAMTIIQNVELRRTMRFNLLALITIPAELISGATAIWLAYKGFGVMSLAVKTILSSITIMILYRCTVRWRPKFQFCASSFSELLKTSLKLTMATILWVIGQNAATIFIGKIFTTLQLGYYSFSERILNMTSSNITSAVQQVSMTSFSKIQDDNERLLGGQRQVVQGTAAIVFPIMAALAVMAEPLFTLFLNESWMPAIPYLRILCVTGALRAVYAIPENLLLVKDVNLYLKVDYTAALTLLALIFALVPSGIDVFLIGHAIHTAVFILVIDYFKSRLLNSRFGSVLWHIAPVAVSSTVMGAAVHFMIRLFGSIGFAQCAILAAVAMAVYVFCLWILRVEAVMRLAGIVKRVRSY